MESKWNEIVDPPSSPQQRDGGIPGLNLAIAALVLGVAAIPFSIMLVGGIYGIIGIILAFIHIKKKYSLQNTAILGLCLSCIGLLLSAGFAAYYIYGYVQFQEAFSMFEDESFEEWINTQAPDFSVKDLDGNDIKLSDFRGRKVVLDFWATWCPPCREEIPHFVKLTNTFDSNELAIIGISAEENNILRQFAKDNNINYIIATEEELPSPYFDVMSLPTTFFIDKTGLIRNVLTGYHDFDELKESIMALDNEPDSNGLD